MDKHPSRFIILISLVLAGVILFVLPSKGDTSKMPSTLPSIPNAEAAQTTSVGSPDGKFTLNMKTEKGKDSTTYSFIMKDETLGSQNTIFTETLPAVSSISIPLNTFSSDDKYVFLKQTSPSGDTYFVLTSSGNPISKDAQTYDFSTPFTAKYPDLTITEATGWAGPTLIVINTNKAGGGLGPSFWFDLSTKSYIQLSERFN